MKLLSTCQGVCILDRPDDEPGQPGQFTKAFEAHPQVAWAWLHTLRTGARGSSLQDIDRWALEEKTRMKRRPRPFKPKILPKLRSQKDDGPSVA